MTENDDNPDRLEAPVYPDISSRMTLDFVFNEDGAWLMHGRPLPDVLRWVEYDADTEQVTLVLREGRLQDIGLKVPADHGQKLFQLDKVTVMFMNEGQVEDIALVPLVARRISLH